MNDKESIVAYPHEIKFINKNGSAISYYVDRKVSDCVKELQDKLSKVENKNREKDIEILQLQSDWNSLREYLEEMKLNKRYDNDVERFTAYDDALDKMNELEGKDKE